MKRFSCVVLLEAAFKISRHSQIALALRRKALNKIYVIHWPSFADASEGILLRAIELCQSVEAHQREAVWHFIPTWFMRLFPAVRTGPCCSYTARVETNAISFQLDANSIPMHPCLARAEKFSKVECRGSFDAWPKGC